MASGIFYGIYHHRSLQKAHDQDKEHHAIHRREQLIAQAKDAWHQKKESSVKGDGGKLYFQLLALSRLLFCGWKFPLPYFPSPFYISDRLCTTVITDPEDPRFDLEKLVAKWEKAYQ